MGKEATEKTYSLELTESELITLSDRIAHIVDRSGEFGASQIRLLSEMAKTHVQQNPVMSDQVIETIGTIYGAFSEISKAEPDFFSIYGKATELLKTI